MRDTFTWWKFDSVRSLPDETAVTPLHLRLSCNNQWINTVALTVINEMNFSDGFDEYCLKRRKVDENYGIQANLDCFIENTYENRLELDVMRSLIPTKQHQVYPVGQTDGSNEVVFYFHREMIHFVVHFPASFYREIQEQQRSIHRSRQFCSEEEKQEFVSFSMLYNELNEVSSVDDIVMFVSLLQMMLICDNHDTDFAMESYHVFEICNGVWSNIKEELW